MTKKLYSTVIVLLLLALTVSGATASTKFTDVGNYWATDAIYWAVNKKVVEGYPDGTFKPSQSVRECEFAAILARYVDNTDKEALKKQQAGKHWSQSIYDELGKWNLPLGGYDDELAKESVVKRGDLARIIAAKNGFNLTERQAIFYMYENDLSSGMEPNKLTYKSYGVGMPLQRDQITQFMKLLSEKGVTTFMGKPSVKGNAGATGMVGIVDVPPETIEITDEMFDELAKEKGIQNPERDPGKYPYANEVAKKYDLKVDDSGSNGFALKEKDTNYTQVFLTMHDNNRSFTVNVYDYDNNKQLAFDLIESTGKVDINEVKEAIEKQLNSNGEPQYWEITGGLVEFEGPTGDVPAVIRIYLFEDGDNQYPVSR